MMQVQIINECLKKSLKAYVHLSCFESCNNDRIHGFQQWPDHGLSSIMFVCMLIFM